MKFNQLKSRRDFIRYGCRTISAIGAASAFGEAGLLNAQIQDPGDYKALVCIFLFGGNDANNMLIPNETATYTHYQTVRGGLAIPRAAMVPIFDPLSQLNFGLHPSLAPLGKLYTDPANPRLSLLANVGTLVQPVPHDPVTKKPNFNGVALPANLYSHSDQQSEWQTGVPQGGPGASTGWQGRLADKIVQVNANAFIPPSIAVSGSALQLVGQTTKPSTIGTKGFAPLTGLNDPRTAALTQMLSLKSGVALVQAAQNSLTGALSVANAVDTAIASSSPLTTQFPNTGLGSQLAQVAQIIQIRAALGAKRQIFFCSMGGYDTHSAQLQQQANLLADLAAGMSAFDQALGALGVLPNVTTFTESDFSRTFQPNGNAGTDHAWGLHALIMGGAVKGGNVFGTFPTLALQGPDDSGDRGNWVPTTSSDQYGAALARWFGLQTTADLDYVFPNLKGFGYRNPPVFG